MNTKDETPTDLSDREPCPFCGSTALSITAWWDDDGEYDAIECVECKGAAPADVWDRRTYAQLPPLLRKQAF